MSGELKPYLRVLVLGIGILVLVRTVEEGGRLVSVLPETPLEVFAYWSVVSVHLCELQLMSLNYFGGLRWRNLGCQGTYAIL